MSIVNLIVALLLMGAIWVAVVKALGASIRWTDRREAAAQLAAEAVPRRSPLADRALPVPPSWPGAANPRTVDINSAMKDLFG